MAFMNCVNTIFLPFQYIANRDNVTSQECVDEMKEYYHIIPDFVKNAKYIDARRKTTSRVHMICNRLNCLADQNVCNSADYTNRSYICQ